MRKNYQVFMPNSDQQVYLSGSKGDRIVKIVVVPLSKTPENIMIKDGINGTNVTVYAGRGDLLAIDTIETMTIHLGVRSFNEGGWRITTGNDVLCWVIGE